MSVCSKNYLNIGDRRDNGHNNPKTGVVSTGKELYLLTFCTGTRTLCHVPPNMSLRAHETQVRLTWALSAIQVCDHKEFCVWKMYRTNIIRTGATHSVYTKQIQLTMKTKIIQNFLIPSWESLLLSCVTMKKHTWVLCSQELIRNVLWV